MNCSRDRSPVFAHTAPPRRIEAASLPLRRASRRGRRLERERRPAASVSPFHDMRLDPLVAPAHGDELALPERPIVCPDQPQQVSRNDQTPIDGLPCALRRPQRPTRCRNHAIPSGDFLSRLVAGWSLPFKGDDARLLPSPEPDIIASDAHRMLKEAKRRPRLTPRPMEEAFHGAKEGIRLSAGAAQPVRRLCAWRHRAAANSSTARRNSPSAA